MNRLRKYLVEVFGFSQGESKGFIIFSILVLILFAASAIVPSIIFKTEFDNKADKARLNEFIKSVKSPLPSIQKPKQKEIEIADPNTMGFFDWTSLGLNEYLADRIISYRLKGGVFQKKEDLKKIYGLNDSIYSQINKYLSVSNTVKYKSPFDKVKYENNDYKKYKTEKSPIPKVKPEINTCDSTDLLFIKGIGPARASRIIKYRAKLGGFQNKNQLSEVYGLDSLVLENLIQNTQLTLNPSIRKLDLNTIKFDELIAHPYVDYKTCKVILNYRNQHGAFQNINDLRKIKIIDSIFINRIIPYLEFR